MSEVKMEKRMPVKVIKVLGKILMTLIISQVCYSSLPVAMKWSISMLNKGIKKVNSWNEENHVMEYTRLKLPEKLENAMGKLSDSLMKSVLPVIQNEMDETVKELGKKWTRQKLFKFFWNLIMDD